MIPLLTAKCAGPPPLLRSGGPPFQPFERTDKLFFMPALPSKPVLRSETYSPSFGRVPRWRPCEENLHLDQL